MSPGIRSSQGIQVQRQKASHLRNGWRFLSRQWIWLVASRVSLLAISFLALVLYIAGIPAYYARLSIPHTNCSDECLTTAKVQMLHTLGISIPAYAFYWIAVNLLFALLFCAVAALIFWRKSNDRMAWFASFALLALGTSFPTIPNALVAVHSPWTFPVALLDAPGLPSLAVFLFLFPNGHFVPRWTRWIAAGFAVLYVCGTLFPDSILNNASVSRPIHSFVSLLVLGTLIYSQLYRYRHVSSSVERQQTKWVVFGTTIALIGFAPAFLLPAFFSLDHMPLFTFVFVISSVYLLLLLIPISIAFAIFRYHLWDIDIIINRTLVYSILTVSIAGVYVLTIVSLGNILQAQGNPLVSLVAAALIAVIFQPLRERLQRMANRIMYGERDDPYRVISRLGQRLEATLAAHAILPAIVETVAQALKLPYTAISLKQDNDFALVASYIAKNGEAPAKDSLLHLPLLYQSEQIGELLLAPRARGEAFTPADHRLLDDLARQVGIAAHAVRLTADLQQSRERLVTTREEERRRLRRDLHDGLGPSLASITLKLDAARNLLARDPGAADSLLVELKKQTQNAVADIRRLVYDLRPPSLDELGLISALREQAEQYIHDGLSITIDAPDPLPPLPAAVEVATYRIIQEAMTNVIRHAQAHVCTIRLSFDESLHIQVRDDGCGIPAEHHAGVGLTSIRERAAELGGTCTIASIPSGGTRLHVRLPLPQTAMATEQEKS